MVWNKKGLKLAFTLAEVLITLGIIGIVAALTIPGLMQNMKGKQYRAKFKKTISTLNQAVRMNQARYDFNFADTNICELDIRNNWGTNQKNLMYISAIFDKNLKGIAGGSYNAYTIEEASAYDALDEYAIDFNVDTMLKVFNNGMVLPSEFFGYKFVEGVTINIPLCAEACTLPLGMTLTEKLSENSSHCCIGYIDLDGEQGMNREVRCSNEETKFEPDKPCVVNNTDVTDVYPIYFHDSTVEPATNAAKYVLNSAK